MPIHLAEHELAGQCRETGAPNAHPAHQAQLAWDGVEGTTSRTPPSFGFDPIEGLGQRICIMGLDAQLPIRSRKRWGKVRTFEFSDLAA
jgi:hypothetical protein